jgi:hypothetical protein
MERLIDERRAFENELYDYLLNNTVLVYVQDSESETEQDSFWDTVVVPDSFWDPVVVSLSTQEMELLETIECVTCECIICAEIQDSFKRVKCCKKSFCSECAQNWFSVSVFCPFCKHDQRNLI